MYLHRDQSRESHALYRGALWYQAPIQLPEDVMTDSKRTGFRPGGSAIPTAKEHAHNVISNRWLEMVLSDCFAVDMALTLGLDRSVLSVHALTEPVS